MTKAKFLAAMKRLNIEIEIHIPCYGRRMVNCHVHAYAPTGYYFKDHFTHNLSLWDSEQAPDWAAIAKDIGDDPLAPCSDGECNKECPTDDDNED